MTFHLKAKKAEGDIDDGDELVVTITDLPKGLNNVYIYWDNAGTPVDMNATYDPVAGTATFTTKHFSTYALVYDGPIKVYSEEDFGLVTSSFRRLLKDRTYVLMNDITDSKLMAFNDGVTIDLNGFTLTTSASYWTNFSNVDYTEINFIDSSTAKTGKIINSSGNLFNLSRNETVITFDESIELVSTAFAAVLFRTQTNSPNTTTVTINNAKATGQFYQAQPYGGTTTFVFNNCEATGESASGVIAQHGYASAAITTTFNNCMFTSTGSVYSTYVLMAQDGYGNVTEKFVIFKDTTLDGALQVRQNVSLDGCTVTGTISKYGSGTVTYLNNTTVNGVVQTNS